MTSSIDFDVEMIIQEIEVLQKVHIPYAANRALKDFGFYAKRFLGEEMRKEFDNPVPLTTRSPYFKMGDLEVTIGINDWAPKGTSPAQYLFPQVAEGGATRKQIKIGRFSGALDRRGITRGVAIPNERSRAAQLLGLTSHGNLRPSVYTRVLGSLNALEMAGPSKGPHKFFVVPSEKPGGHLPPGVYHRKARTLSQLMSLAETAPAVTPKFPFAKLLEEEAADHIPTMLSKRLKQATGR